MPRRRLAPDQIDDFRARLCETAIQMFAEVGYDAVSLRALAERVGCSHATPYRYFADKGEIFAAVCATGFERFGAALRSAARSTDDPVARLRAIGHAYVDFGTAQAHMYRIMFELRNPTAEAYPQHRASERAAWEPLRDAVEAAVRDGVLVGDVDTLAHEMWVVAHGIVSLHLASKLVLGRDVHDLLDPLFDLLLDGNRSHAPQEPHR